MTKQSENKIIDPILEEAKANIKKKTTFLITAGLSLLGIIAMLFLYSIDPDEAYPLLFFIAFLVLFNAYHTYSLFFKKTKKKKSWKDKAIENEYLKLKEREHQSLSESEMLELKELEKRYDDRDFV